MSNKKKEEVKQVESIEELEADVEVEAEAPAPVGAHKNKSKAKETIEMVEIDLPVEVKINGESFFGKINVPVDVAQTILPMAQAKMRQDTEISVGRSYIAQRMVDGSLVIKEGSIDKLKRG